LRLTPAARLLRDLVAIPSVSGNEAAVVERVADELRALGLAPEVRGRNVFAERGTGGPPRLLLNSHLDTVPAGPGWTLPPTDPVVRRGRLFGLGANDAKGPATALLRAFAAAPERALRGTLLLALTCDEETGGEGLEKLLPTLPPVHAGVIGEPTALRIARAQRGLVRLELHAEGRAAHAARPEQGVNAIERALDDLARLRRLRFPKRHALLGRTRVAATMIEGGVKANVIPPSCRVVLDVRTTPDYPNERVVAAIGRAVRARVVIQSQRIRPVETAADDAIVRAARAALPRAPLVGFGGVSDYFFLAPVPGIVLGPGTPEQSHAPDESIAVADLERGVGAYGRVIRAWFARSR